MFTDMVGYTALTQLDERRSLELLEEQEAAVRPLLNAYHGRAVKSTGDGLLAEFPSALQATECAVAIQRRLSDRNRESGGPPIELRIGIHLGDVEERNEDIFGDAVNIAARVQPIADPGGIAISQQVYDQIRNKISLPLEKLERRSLKGVEAPMDVYRVVLSVGRPMPSTPTPAAGPNRLAVLPLANISPEPQDAYFSDGLTEEVITTLSELPELRVIARTSVEPYKTAPKPIAQVGTELGVGWVLEGSVRKARTRLRIALQLVDVRTQEHVWSATYDRELDDVFALQSDVAHRVAEALKIRLGTREKSRLDRRPTVRPESYLEYLQGRTCLHGIEQAKLLEAREHFERALALDDRNAAAHAGLSEAHALVGSIYRYLPRPEWTELARREADRAIELDPDLAEAHTALALAQNRPDGTRAGERELRRAIELNPSYAGAHFWCALALADLGRPEEALREFAIAGELDPLSALVLAEEVSLLIDLGRLNRAEARLERLGQVEPKPILFEDRRASLLLARGDLESFHRSIERFDQLLPGRPETLATRALYHALVGQKESARELLQKAQALPEPVRPTAHIARVYAALGDLDSCFRWMEVAADRGELSPRTWRYSERVATVRQDPRFTTILRRLDVE